MDIDVIIDKYRQTAIFKRLVLVAFIGTLPALNYWYDEADSLKARLDGLTSQESDIQSQLDATKLKVAELPALEAQIGAVEGELQTAKKILPGQIYMDKVLAEIGYLEQNRGIKLVKFVPGNEVKPIDSNDYVEVPVELSVKGEFSDVMDFYDSILHTPYLTHIRAITFVRDAAIDNEDKQNAKKENLIVSNSKMILFKGNF